MRYCLTLFLAAGSLLFGYEESHLPPVEERPSPLKTKYMSGNWDGWRDILENKGVVFTSSYLTEMVGNPTGGQAQGFTYTGSYGLELDIDFEKACGATGFGFFTSMAWRSGTSLSKTKIGNQFPVQEIYGGQTVKLNELYLKETVWDGRLLIKAGRMNGLNDFLISPLYLQFLNLAFCGNPVSILYNTALTDYPYGEWGAYLECKPVDMLVAKVGVYNGNTEVIKNRFHGVNFTFKSTNGVIWITEWALLVNQKKEDSSYPGNYKVGFFYQTANTKIYSGGVGGDPGFYFQMDQQLYDGITPFVAMIIQPKDRNLLPVFLTSGIVCKGIVRNRPNDALSLGYAYGKFSSDLGTGQNFESVFEMNYWFQINEWFSFIPDLQFIVHPKGTDIPNALCLGFQMGFIL